MSHGSRLELRRLSSSRPAAHPASAERMGIPCPNVGPSPIHCRSWVLLAACFLVAGCTSSEPGTSAAVQVTPTNASVVVGQQVQFTATCPLGTDFTWSVDPPSAGTIDAGGRFTAKAVPSSGVCSVVATLKSDPSRIGLAVVTISPAPTPTSQAVSPNLVSATGGRQTGGAMEVEVLAQESVPAITSSSSTGTMENRSGFFPAASPGTP